MEATVYLLPHPPSSGSNTTPSELGSVQLEEGNVTQMEVGSTGSLKSRKTTALLATIYEEVLHLLFVLANSDEGIFAMVKSSELFFLRLLFLLSIPNPLGQLHELKAVNLFRGRILKLLGIIACYSRTTQIAISHAFTFSASTHLEARRFETISGLFMKSSADKTFQTTVLSFLNILINTTLDPMDRIAIRDDLQHFGMADQLEKYHRQGLSVHPSDLFLQLQIYFRQLGNDKTRPYHRAKCVTHLETLKAETEAKDSEALPEERIARHGLAYIDNYTSSDRSELKIVGRRESFKEGGPHLPSTNIASGNMRPQQRNLELHHILDQLQRTARSLDEENAKRLSEALNLINNSIRPTTLYHGDCLLDSIPDTVDSPTKCMQIVESNHSVLIEKDMKKALKSSASKQSSIGSRVMSIPFIQGLRRGIGYTPPSSPIRDSRSRKVVEAFFSKSEQDNVTSWTEPSSSVTESELHEPPKASECESPKLAKVKKTKRLHINFSLPSLNHFDSAASPVEPGPGTPADTSESTPSKDVIDSSAQERMMNGGRRPLSPRRNEKSTCKPQTKKVIEANSTQKETARTSESVEPKHLLPTGKGDAVGGACLETGQTVKDNPAYSKFFKLLAMGAPPIAVKAKMEMAGLKSELLDTPDANMVSDKTNSPTSESKEHVEIASCLPPPPPTKAGISASNAISGLFRRRLDKVGMEPETQNVASAEHLSGLVKNDPNYAKFFKMLNMGIPLVVVRNKMKLAGFVEELLEKPDESLEAALAAHKMNDSRLTSLLSNDRTRGKQAWYSNGEEMELPVPPPIRKSTTRPLYWQYIKDDKAIKGTVWEELAGVKTEAEQCQHNNAEYSLVSQVRLNDTDILELETRFPANPGILNKNLINGTQKGPLSISASSNQLSSLNESTPLSPRVVFLIDRSRSNNISIITRQFRLSNENIRDAIKKLDNTILTLERVQGLLKILPTDEEVAAITGFGGDVTLLNGAEKLLKELISIPRLRPRLNTFQARLQFSNLVSETQNRIDRLQAACIELLGSRDLKSTLFLILQVGNKMNEGTSRGEAKGFSLSDLPKLSQLKTADKKETLLHFIAKYLRQKCGEAVQLQNSLTCLCDIQNVSIVEISHDVDRLKECIDSVATEVDAKKIRKAIDELENGDTYIEYMGTFVEEASPIVAEVNKKWTEALVLAQETLVKFEKSVIGDDTATSPVAPGDAKAAQSALLTGLSSIFNNIHEFSFQLMRTDRENELRRIRDEKQSQALEKNKQRDTEGKKGSGMPYRKERIGAGDSKNSNIPLHEPHVGDSAPQKDITIMDASVSQKNLENKTLKPQDSMTVDLVPCNQNGIFTDTRKKEEGSCRQPDPVNDTLEQIGQADSNSEEKFQSCTRSMKNRYLRQGSALSGTSISQIRSDFVKKNVLLTKKRNKIYWENKKSGLLISKRHSYRKPVNEDGFIRAEISPEQLYLSETVLLSEDELHAGTYNHDTTLKGNEGKKTMGKKRIGNSKRHVNKRSVQLKLSIQPTEHAQQRTRTAAL
nr:forminhomology 2 domaincontaining protein putative [Albugo laibachii Nc14]|eukprot:CCA16325.1 forminhomology 2 domaincontaining protein putative [Albugo laibachii Nc14]